MEAEWRNEVFSTKLEVALFLINEMMKMKK
jgi:hypothetical protein